MLPDADTTNADSLVDSGKTPPGRSVRLSRSFAFFQVALIWVVPTQVLVGAILAVGTGIQVVQGGNLSLEFFAMLSLLDTAVVALLIRLFLSLSGETSREVFVGPRRPAGEILRGLLFVPVVSIAVTLIVLRFDQRLWGMKLGLVLFSVFFGIMHVNQGVDAAVGVGVLGVFWGVLYMTRRSAVMAMVNHAGFNAAQVLLLASKTLGE